MADRLTDLVLGLQRMAENARLRGDDLRYMQQQDNIEHIAFLDQLLSMLGKAHAVLLEERSKFMPAEQRPQVTSDKLPRVVTQGPIKKVEAG